MGRNSDSWAGGSVPDRITISPSQFSSKGGVIPDDGRTILEQAEGGAVFAAPASVRLDSLEFIGTCDPSGLRHRLRSMPESCRGGWEQGSGLVPPSGWGRVRRLVVAGMGGSAIVGDLVSDLASAGGELPVSVVRELSIPFSLDDETLLVACSHSGSTRETLAMFRQAHYGGTPALVMAGGGLLEEEARSAGVPFLKIDAPGEPRSALGFNLLLLLGALHRCGLLTTSPGEAEEAMASLEEAIARWAEEVPAADNPAKQLASELDGRAIVIYGGGILAGMARRWKTQFNENAKVWAFFEALPEALHNSVEAFAGLDEAAPASLLLRPWVCGAELERRFDIAAELLRVSGALHRVVNAPEASPLSQVLHLLALGDYASFYLAMLRGVDPSPTPGIQRGKTLLEASG